ncbi:Snf7 [Carpediemonas membranifera]|uniref:Snf7 n=1 Tax=Carpediemonas membranifera TaxID=201153 RepID=A0A8J6E8N9_9EUKA|nr:Snf7 [Carpediemonas membranifera]|eukprot:KAG9392185.1 Snf7 [Carpediemonas membranifera]
MNIDLERARLIYNKLKDVSSEVTDLLITMETNQTANEHLNFVNESLYEMITAMEQVQGYLTVETAPSSLPQSGEVDWADVSDAHEDAISLYDGTSLRSDIEDTMAIAKQQFAEVTEQKKGKKREKKPRISKPKQQKETKEQGRKENEGQKQTKPDRKPDSKPDTKHDSKPATAPEPFAPAPSMCLHVKKGHTDNSIFASDVGSAIEDAKIRAHLRAVVTQGSERYAQFTSTMAIAEIMAEVNRSWAISFNRDVVLKPGEPFEVWENAPRVEKKGRRRHGGRGRR